MWKTCVKRLNHWKFHQKNQVDYEKSAYYQRFSFDIPAFPIVNKVKYRSDFWSDFRI